MRLAIISIAVALAATNGVAQSPGVRAADLTDITAANDRLFRGIRSSDVGAVKVALEQRADVNARSAEGDTALMFAAVLSTTECLKVLLDGGADPNARDKRGGTALMRAIPNIEKVRLLLDRGAEVDARSDLGVSALMVAASSPGASDIVKLLLTRKADPTTPARAGRFAGVPPLMYAVDFGDLESVKALVAAGADVKTGRSNGATPLFWASNGPLDVLVWLLERGADPNATNPRGMTPLMGAAGAGAADNVRALLDRGADVNATDERGTALIHASGSDRAGTDTIGLLLARGADPNIVGKRCNRCIHDPRPEDGSMALTALMLARQRGESDIVKMLIAAGAKR
jgi:ankyrin repeat protein